MFEDIIHVPDVCKGKKMTIEEFKILFCTVCVDVQDCRMNYVKHCYAQEVGDEIPTG
jgi:hypothetical protein